MPDEIIAITLRREGDEKDLTWYFEPTSEVERVKTVLRDQGVEYREEEVTEDDVPYDDFVSDFYEFNNWFFRDGGYD